MGVYLWFIRPKMGLANDSKRDAMDKTLVNEGKHSTSGLAVS